MLNKILLSLALISLIGAVIYAPKALRVYKMINLYDQDKIAFNFINMDKVFQTGPMIPASIEQFVFSVKEFELPQTYFFEGEDRNLVDALDYYETDGLIVLNNETILYGKIGFYIGKYTES